VLGVQIIRDLSVCYMRMIKKPSFPTTFSISNLNK